jgi:AcrR family transcriptional regulator
MKTRDELIRVAGRLFSEHGFDGVSVRDLTHAAKANLGSVTYHFGTKERLFSEVIAGKIEPLKKMGVEIAQSNDRPELKLRRMLKAFALHCLHKDPELRGLFVGIITAGDHLPVVAVEGMKMRNRIFGDVMQEGIMQGGFRKCDVETAAWHFFGMLSPYILFQSLMGECNRKGAYPEKYVNRVVDAALDVFMNGLLSKKSRTRNTQTRKRTGVK